MTLYSLVKVHWDFGRKVKQAGNKKEAGSKTALHNIIEYDALHSHQMKHLKLKCFKSLYDRIMHGACYTHLDLNGLCYSVIIKAYIASIM
jgi:hypothetical protein